MTAVPQGEELIRIEKSDTTKDQKETKSKDLKPPEKNGPKIISLGANASKTTTFSVDLPSGHYNLSYLLKISDPPCVEATVNNKKTILNCMPVKNDVVCSGVSLTVGEQDVDKIVLRAGVSEQK